MLALETQNRIRSFVEECDATLNYLQSDEISRQPESPFAPAGGVNLAVRQCLLKLVDRSFELRVNEVQPVTPAQAKFCLDWATAIVYVKQIRAWTIALLKGGDRGTPEDKGKVKSDDEGGWILVSDALTQLPFLRNLNALYKFADENPGKLRLRPHPNHKQRHQANAGDVLRLSKEYSNKQFEAMGSPGADSLPSLTEESLAPLAARLTRVKAEKRKK